MFLNPTKALIFRIVHVRNLSWIVDHGLHCSNSPTQDPNYVSIGNTSLIDKRAHRTVPIQPGGTLSDYVPFYFTPFSMMLYNIKTGYGGITKRDNEEIAIIVSSIHRLKELGLPFVFTNQHAYAVDTDFYNDVEDLTKVDWPCCNVAISRQTTQTRASNYAIRQSRLSIGTARWKRFWALAV